MKGDSLAGSRWVYLNWGRENDIGTEEREHFLWRDNGKEGEWAVSVALTSHKRKSFLVHGLGNKKY